MGAVARGSAPDRPVLALAVPPPPTLPSRPRRAVAWLSDLRCAAVARLRFPFLAGLACRVATRQQRERAWVAGFEYGFGARDREPFWAPLLDEFEDGNEAGIAASMPIWRTGGSVRTAEQTMRPGLVARAAAHLLPATRAHVAHVGAQQDSRLDDILGAVSAITGKASAGREGPRTRTPLALVDTSAWKDKT
jgi:hypothetical protein